MSNNLETLVASAEFFSDPYPIYQQLREEAPVYWSDHWTGWLVTSYQDVFDALRAPQVFSNAGRAASLLQLLPESERASLAPLARHYTAGLSHSDPPAHTRLRAVVNKAYTPRLVEILAERIQYIADELIDARRAQRQMDVIAHFARPLSIRILDELLGIPEPDRAQVAEWTRDLLELVGGVDQPIAATALHAQAALQELSRYLGELAGQRACEPRSDLLSSLAVAQEQDRVLTHGELINTAVTVLIGGYDTTTNLIGNGLVALFRNPEVMSELTNKPKLMDLAVEELLRYDSPLQSNTRIALRDIELQGQRIRQGDRIHLMLGAANRDPAQFPEPDRLDPERRENRHLAFGHGIHYCLGAALARVQGRVAFGVLLHRLPALRLTSRQLEWRPTLTVHGLKELPVAF